MENAHFCYDPIAEEREIKQLEARSEFRNEALKKRAEKINIAIG